jgi:hypothetical protein
MSHRLSTRIVNASKGCTKACTKFCAAKVAPSNPRPGAAQSDFTTITSHKSDKPIWQQNNKWPTVDQLSYFYFDGQKK